jgi:hypothetical protein
MTIAPRTTDQERTVAMLSALIFSREEGRMRSPPGGIVSRLQQFASGFP